MWQTAAQYRFLFIMAYALAILASCLAVAFAVPHAKRAGTLSNAQSSLTFVFQNNLNASDDNNHVGAILLDPLPASVASTACGALGESLLAQATVQNYSTDFSEALAYIDFKYGIGPLFQVQNGVLSAQGSALSVQGVNASSPPLPVLCTQSSNASQPPNSTATKTDLLTIQAAGNKYVGYRNQKSFRFLGIRYADTPARYAYSKPYSKTGQTLNATAYGSQCVQVGSGGSEDCLFLNIQTPYIPKVGSTTNLRPVYFWIHGGGTSCSFYPDCGPTRPHFQRSAAFFSAANDHFRLHWWHWRRSRNRWRQSCFSRRHRGGRDKLSPLNLGILGGSRHRNQRKHVSDQPQRCSGHP
jgi:hypothetical protein